MTRNYFRPSTPNEYRVRGIRIKAPEAYIHNRYWVIAFEHAFPEKAEKMRQMSQENGWFADDHYNNWFQPCLEWVKKNTDKRRCKQINK